MSEVNFSDLLGVTLQSITIDNDKEGVTLKSTDGRQWRMSHSQDCCEHVAVEDVVGDLDDLIGNPILMAEEVTSGENPEGVTMEYQDSFTWTFYKLATIKGYVTIRWYGESNGYYSEGVDFYRIGGAA